MYPQRVPVNPAVFDREQNSIAQVFAPSISKILRGDVYKRQTVLMLLLNLKSIFESLSRIFFRLRARTVRSKKMS